jgi:hypothetical protein
MSLHTLEKRRKRVVAIIEGEAEELLRKEQEAVEKRSLSFRSSLLLPSPPQHLASSSVTSPSSPLESLYFSSFLTDLSETATRIKEKEKQKEKEQEKGNQKKEGGTSLWNLLNTKVAS